VWAPTANAYAERWVGTVQAECLDWPLIVGRGHLDRVLRVCVQHYNRHRPHWPLGLQAPDPPPTWSPSATIAPRQAAPTWPTWRPGPSVPGELH